MPSLQALIAIAGVFFGATVMLLAIEIVDDRKRRNGRKPNA